jgi:DNA polymerase-3 subunit alpha
VRFGLTAVKNVGENAILSILDHRGAAGRFRSLHDICQGVDLRLVNKRVLESLVKAGALDALAPPSPDGTPRPLRQVRAQLMAALDAAVEQGNRSQRDRDLGQADLFGGGGDHDEHASPTIGALPMATAWTEMEQLNAEKEALGLFWSGHPIDAHADDLKAFGARSIGEILSDAPSEAPPPAAAPAWGRNGRNQVDDTTVGGIVAAMRPLKTRKGDRMAVFTLEDRHGGIEVLVFPDAYARAAPLIENGTLVVVRGKLERDDEECKILASEVLGIGTVREKLARELAITIPAPLQGRTTFEALAELFERHRGDKPVTLQLEVRLNDRPVRVSAQVSAQIRVRPSPDFLAAVQRICGEGSVALR